MPVYHRAIPRLLSGCLLIGWVFLSWVQGAIATPLTIGSISNEPAGETRLYTPIVRHVARYLAPHGITEGQVRIAANIKHMAQLLRDGEVDFYMDSPMPSILVNHMAGSTMILRRWKKGVASYRSVIFVRKESPIETLAQLSGHLVGFEDPYSSSGHILPRIAMLKAGLNLVDHPDFRRGVPTGQTGYIFNHDDESTMVRVLMGRLDAGAMARQAFQHYASHDALRLRIIHTTFSVPRHTVSIRAGLPEAVTSALRQALLTMDQHSEGRALLQAFEKTVRFDALPPDTAAHLQRITPTVLDIMGPPP